jgi:hypothetical protein
LAASWREKAAEEEPFADLINSTPKVVVSNTLNSVEWRNSTLITGKVVEELTEMKRQPGRTS